MTYRFRDFFDFDLPFVEMFWDGYALWPRDGVTEFAIINSSKKTIFAITTMALAEIGVSYN